VLTLSVIALAAPILREIFSKSDLDERQRQISHASSHIAYFVYTALLIFAVAREWLKTGEIPSALIFFLLAAPLVIKLVLCLVQGYGGVSGWTGFVNLFFRGLIPTSKLDERQNVLGNLSSHVAFYVFLTLTLVVVLFKYVHLGLEPTPLWNMLLFVPLLSKLYVSLFQTYGAHKGAKSVVYVIVGFAFVFVLLSHGLSLGAFMEASPFLLVLAAAFFSHKIPRIAGAVFLLVAVLMLVLMKGWVHFDLYTSVLMWALIPIPFIISGLALIISGRQNSETSELG
jgi:hypothetical protein